MFCEAITAYGEPLQRLDTPTPQPQGTEVLLEITECGVCHSDVHLHDGYFGMGGDNKLDVRAGAGTAALSCPAPNRCPPTARYIARSTMIGTPLVTVIAAETSAAARAGSS